jgi:cysteinyl-tRNA synthetase
MQNLVKIANQMLRNKTELDVLLSVVKLFDDLFEVFGLQTGVSPLSKEDKVTYKAWVQARQEKNFEEADKHRQILQEKGII